jgi:hypothetical protein
MRIAVAVGPQSESSSWARVGIVGIILSKNTLISRWAD